MANVNAVWIDGSADWNTPLDWNDDIVPNDAVTGSTTEVTLPGSTAYTVTISAGENFTVDSVSITDPLATLAVEGSSSTHTSLTVTSTSATAFTNSGTLGLHNNTSVTVDGGFTNSGTLDVDNAYVASGGALTYSEGGSSLTISGTLANIGAVQIGDRVPYNQYVLYGLTAATTVTLGGLTNAAGDSFLLDGSSKYAATLAFTGSGIGFTSNAGDFELTYASPLTLTASFSNGGTFAIHNNTSVTVDGGFTNSGTLDVDNAYVASGGALTYSEGGSSLTISSTLANTGAVQIGDRVPYNQYVLYGLTAATTVTLGGLTNAAGDSFLLDGSSKYAATLAFTGSGIGFTSNAGDFELTYASPLTLTASFSNGGTFAIHNNTSVTVDGGFTNSGTLDVDNAYVASGGALTYSEGGSSLTISSTLANTGAVQIGDRVPYNQYVLYGLTAATTVTLGGLTNAAGDSFLLDGSSKYAATLAFTGSGIGFTSNAGDFELTYASPLTLTASFSNGGTFAIHNNTSVTVDGGFTNSGTLDVDNAYVASGGALTYSEGGSSLTISSTLANTGAVQIGDRVPYNQYVLYGLTAATTVTLGGLTNAAGDSFLLDGSSKYAATLAFTGSGIGFTSNAGDFELTYASPLTLTASFSNGGTFAIHNNTSVTVDGGFTNSGTLDVDNAYVASGGALTYSEGGSSLTISSTLANTGAVQIGDRVPYNQYVLYGLTAATTVTLGGLTNAAGDSFLLDGSSKYAATLAFTGSGIGFTSNAGDFELTYASPLTLTASFSNGGTFAIHNNTSVTVDGGFTNSGTLDVDNAYVASGGALTYSEGGSSLTISGTLANIGAVQIGDRVPYNQYVLYGLTAATTVTLGGLTNAAGDSFLLDGSSKYAATLAFTGSGIGFTSNAGDFELTYASPLTLTASFSNGGTFAIHNNTSVTVDGGFTNSGTLDVDNAYVASGGALTYSEGGSSLTISSTLANTGAVQIGDRVPYNQYVLYGLTAATTVTLGGLTNSANASFNAYGSSSYAATVTVDGLVSNAGTLNVGDYSVFDVTGGNAFTQTGGTTTISADGSFSAATIDIDGGNFVVDTTNFTNIGKLAAAYGGEINFSAGGLTNLSGGTLTGGTYEVDAGSTLQLPNNSPIVTDDADIILSGSGSTIQSLDTSTNTEQSFDFTWRTISATGQLHLLAGRSLSTAAVITNDGQLELGGGTLAVTGLGSSLTDDAGSWLYGFGVVTATTFTNSGLIEAIAGGDINLGASDLTNLSGGTLTGGIYEADPGSTLQLPNNAPIVTDAATIILNGAGSEIQSLNTTSNTEATLETTLTAISAGGALELLGGRNFMTSDAINNAGTLVIASGVLGGAALTDASGSTLSGFGTVANAFTGAGTVTASGGTLSFTGTGDSFSGAINGSGNLAFTGGSDALNSGATITTASLTISGAGTSVSVNEALSYGGTFTEGAGSTVTIAGGDALNLSGNSTIAGSIGGGGALAFSGGSDALNSGATITTANLSESGAGTLLTLAENLSYGDAFTEGAGSTLSISSGDTLTLTGTSNIGGAVSGAGTLALTGGTATIESGTNLSVADWSISGAGTTVTLDEAVTYAGFFSEGAGATLTGGPGTPLTLTGSANFTGGTLNGAHEINTEGATAVSGLTIGGTAIWYNYKTVTQSGGNVTVGDGTGATAVLSNTATGTYDITDNSGIGRGTSTTSHIANAGQFEKTGGTGTSAITASFTDTGAVTVASGTLSFAGPSNSFAGAITGAGTFLLAGGATTILSGANFSVANWSISGAGTTVTLAENLDYEGNFTEGAGSTLSISSGDTLTLTGTSNIGGTVSGAGKLTLAGGGSTTILSGTNFSVADWSISGAGTTVTLDEAVTYAGFFSEGAGATLTGGPGTPLTLTGSANFTGGTLNGAHEINTEGATAVSGLTIGGTAIWYNYKTVTQSGGNVTVGDGTGATAVLSNTATGTYDITDNSGIGRGTSTTSHIANAGQFEKTGGTGTSAITASFTDTGAVTVASGTLSFAGPSNSFAGAITGAGTFLLAGGATTILSGANLSVANWSISGAGTTVTLAENLDYEGNFTEGAGSTLSISSGDTLTLTGTSNIGGTVSGAGKLTLAGGGSTTILSGTNFSVADWSISGAGTTVTLDEAVTYAGFFSEGAGATLTGGPGTPLTLTGSANFTGGTLNGAHEINTEGATAVSGLTIGGTAIWYNYKTVTQSGGNVTVGDGTGATAVLSNTATGTYDITDNSGIGRGTSTTSHIANAGQFEKTGGTGTSAITASFTDTGAVTVASGTLSFAGPSNSFAGAITGAGTFLLAGGATTILSGANLSVANWSISGAGTTVTLAENLDYEGNFTEGAGSTLSISSGDTLTLTGTSNIGGAVSGAGTLALTGGSTTIESGANLSVAKWSISGAGTTVTLDEAVTYAGSFSEGAGATLTGGPGTPLTLTGSANFTGGTLNGAHEINTEGATAVSGLTIGGTAIWYNYKTVTQSGGNVTVGDGTGATAVLSNTATGTYDITDNSGIGRGSSTTSHIANAGLFEKTGGTGTSVVTPSINNTGTIEVSSGTLDLQGAVTNTGTLEATSGGHLDVASALSGTGQLKIGAGSEVELGVATTENSTFLGTSSAKLRIDNATTTAYTGTIGSFVLGDVLELGNTDATEATPTFNSGTDTTTLTVDLSSGGPLTYTLAGNLSGDTFSVTHVNGGADSDITDPIAPANAFAEGYSLLTDPVTSSFVETNGVFGGSGATQSGGPLDLAAAHNSHA